LKKKSILTEVLQHTLSDFWQVEGRPRVHSVKNVAEALGVEAVRGLKSRGGGKGGDWLTIAVWFWGAPSLVIGKAALGLARRV